MHGYLASDGKDDLLAYKLMATGIFSCVIAVLSAGYLAATLLLLGGID